MLRVLCRLELPPCMVAYGIHVETIVRTKCNEKEYNIARGNTPRSRCHDGATRRYDKR